MYSVRVETRSLVWGPDVHYQFAQCWGALNIAGVDTTSEKQSFAKSNNREDCTTRTEWARHVAEAAFVVVAECFGACVANNTRDISWLGALCCHKFGLGTRSGGEGRPPGSLFLHTSCRHQREKVSKEENM